MHSKDFGMRPDVQMKNLQLAIAKFGKTVYHHLLIRLKYSR